MGKTTKKAFKKDTNKLKENLIMEQKENKKKRVNMWHWNQPEQGMSIEDCEQLVDEFRLSIQKASLNPTLAILLR